MQSQIWFRYIDDIFSIWTTIEKELDKFLNHHNSLHPNLRFTDKCSKESLNFLDVIGKIQDEFVIDLYCQSTDGEYLHFEPCHASHTKTSVVYSQAHRMKRICTRSSDLIANITKVKNWFRERGYLEEILNKETKRALESSISSSNSKSTPAPFIPFMLLGPLGPTQLELKYILWKKRLWVKKLSQKLLSSL